MVVPVKLSLGCHTLFTNGVLLMGKTSKLMLQRACKSVSLVFLMSSTSYVGFSKFLRNFKFCAKPLAESYLVMGSLQRSVHYAVNTNQTCSSQLAASPMWVRRWEKAREAMADRLEHACAGSCVRPPSGSGNPFRPEHSAAPSECWGMSIPRRPWHVGQL